MKRLASPALWLPLLLLLLTLTGAILLFPDASTSVDARTREFYSTRHFILCSLHALSAAAGCGLFTYNIDSNFTTQGQLLLFGLGLAGSIAFIAAILQSLRRLVIPIAAQRDHPAIPIPLPALAILFAVVPLLLDFLLRSFWPPAGPCHASRTIGAAFSLGWYAPNDRQPPWVLPVLSFFGAVGGTFWLQAMFMPLGTVRSWLNFRRLGSILLCYAAWLLLIAFLVSTFETRRSYRSEAGPSDKLFDQPAGARLARSFSLVASSSGAGIATEPITDRGVSDATKALLAAAILVGGLPGSPVGGMTFLALFLALGGATVAQKLLGLPNHADRAVRIASTVVLAEIAAALLAAFGLLLIEHLTAACFQSPPSFADALLDAASLVGGASLSSGLASTITSDNLSSGMRQSADLYIYGTAWMMLAMLIGRALPVWILCRAATPATPRPH